MAPERLRRSRKRHPVLFGVWVMLVVVIALALILFLVLPTRTWLGQRSSIVGHHPPPRRASTRRTTRWRTGSAALQTPDEIERVARQQYGMVRPGEQADSVVPAPTAQPLPAGWPYTVLSGILGARGIAAPVAPPTTAVTVPAARAAAKPAAKPGKSPATTAAKAAAKPAATATTTPKTAPTTTAPKKKAPATTAPKYGTG